MSSEKHPRKGGPRNPAPVPTMADPLARLADPPGADALDGLLYIADRLADAYEVEGASERANVAAKRIELAVDGIYVLPGDEAREREIHRLLDEYRKQGEWFHRVPSVDRFVRLSAEIWTGDEA